MWYYPHFANAADKKSAQLEKQLVQMEKIMDQMVSANEHFSRSLQDADPASRPAMCHLLSELGKTAQADMKKLSKGVRQLEAKKNYSLLTEQQVIRLEKQKNFIGEFKFASCND